MARTSENLPLKTAAKNAPQKTAPAAFTLRENKLCAELGLSPDALLRRRTYFLKQGHHWDYVDKRVMYSAVGAEILRSTRDSVIPAAPPKNAATADSKAARRPVALLLESNPPPVEFGGELIVWGVPPRNPKVITCYVPGTDPYNPMNLKALRVRDNKNFLRGMKIPPAPLKGKLTPPVQVKINPIKERPDVFELDGPTPRWRGKW